ncbi:MAG: thioesterase family protein [bacterium]|nr:thioesterase family protein [bacterium]MCY4273356.1 thioesterase family protein [bacterium]
MSGNVPDLLRLAEVGEQRYQVFQPPESAEGRDVVFSGQLMAQMMMASDAEADGAKDIRSVHAVFARAGTYTRPIEVDVDSMQVGRTWASDAVTAAQGGKLLSRALILMSTLDDDLMRHEPAMPDVASPDGLHPGSAFVFPGAEWRPVPGEPEIDGVPVERAWHRYEPGSDSQAANQGIAGWATCGSIIGLAMRPHPEAARIEQAHRTLSTGVIAHTLHFLDRLDVSQWLLIQMQATKAANGRVYGRGEVFTAAGQLVAAFQQDSMAKAAPAPLDPSRSM